MNAEGCLAQILPTAFWHSLPAPAPHSPHSSVYSVSQTFSVLEFSVSHSSTWVNIVPLTIIVTFSSLHSISSTTGSGGGGRVVVTGGGAGGLVTGMVGGGGWVVTGEGVGNSNAGRGGGGR